MTAHHNEIAEIELSLVENEPRALDLDIAAHLGFSRPRDVRKLIERNIAELERFGVCAMVARTPGSKGGRPTEEYWLNEEQSLLVAVLSDAENAPAVRHMLIKVFVAWRRGHITGTVDFDPSVRSMLGGMIKRNTGVAIREALTPVQEELRDTQQQLAELKDRLQSPNTCTAHDMWTEFQLRPVKGGTVWLGNRLIEMGCAPEFGSRSRSGSTWRRQFDAGRARIAMNNGLHLLAKRHIEERLGQGRLKLVQNE